MTMGNQEPREPLTQPESYNVALQLHNQEFRALGERTGAFLLIQSVLVAAFVTVLVSQNTFAYAFEFIALGIGLVGILYCIIHNHAGSSGSQAAFRWRQYLRSIENNQENTPWNWVYEHCPHTCHGRGIIRFLTQLRCERCLLEKSPLPTTWLVSPAIFLLAWIVALVYVIIWYVLAPPPPISSLVYHNGSRRTNYFGLCNIY